MSWRILVIQKRAKLHLKMNYLVIRSEETKKVFLGEISTVIIESTAVSMTAALLIELINRKIKVVFCDDKRFPLAELVPYAGSSRSSEKVRFQMDWSEVMKNKVWEIIVKDKILHQAELLKKINREESQFLYRYMEQVEVADKTNREGHAAKVYFNALFGKDFSRDQDNEINSALNYGYSILLSAVSREINAGGYVCQIGIFHHNIFNSFNLACDLMEPFRPLVDRIVFYQEHWSFDSTEKMELVNVLNQCVMIDGKKHYVNNAIKIFVKSVLDGLDSDELDKIKLYSHDEL